MAETVVELKNVRKVLVTRSPAGSISTEVFNGLDLAIRPGEQLGVLGPSGSGKTTLLKLINRLLNADAGEVRVNGRDVKDWDVLRLRRYAALVLQKPYVFDGTVRDNVLYAYQVANLAPPPDDEIRRFLADAGLPDIDVRRPASALSAGEQQRLCLARALALDPGVLLLDETTASLDPAVASAVLRNIYAKCRNGGLTLIHVTHETPKLMDLDRLAVIASGRVAEEGPPSRVLQGPSAFVRDALRN